MKTKIDELGGKTIKEAMNIKGCEIIKYELHEYRNGKMVPIDKSTTFVKFYEKENVISIQAKPG